jgi:uncharacterized protein (TIGR02271 family)
VRDHDKDTIDSTRLRGGMQVVGAAGQPLGAIERFDDAELVVQGQRYPLAAIDRIEGDRVYLAARAGQTRAGAAGAVTGAGATTGAARPAAAGTTAPAAAEASARVVDRAGEVRVPVVEERLEVETRPVELGAVEVRTTVETEQQTVPVELAREEVRVRREEVPARPATDAADDAFEEGTVRVPVRGEEAVARKATVVTGEVVIDKARATETQQVAETVRRERVEVDEAAARPAAETGPGAGAPTTGAAAGTGAVGFGRVGLRDVAAGAEVVGADGAAVGRVKEVRDGDVLVDRRGQRDVYVPFAAVAEATAGGLRLTVPADAVDDQGWPHPPLL